MKGLDIHCREASKNSWLLKTGEGIGYVPGSGASLLLHGSEPGLVSPARFISLKHDVGL